MTTALVRALTLPMILGALCGGAVRVLAESAARHPGALWLPRTDLNIVLGIAALLVGWSALLIARSGRAAATAWEWRGAILAWPAFVVSAAVVAGPIWTVYLLGLPLLLLLAIGLLATRTRTGGKAI